MGTPKATYLWTRFLQEAPRVPGASRAEPRAQPPRADFHDPVLLVSHGWENDPANTALLMTKLDPTSLNFGHFQNNGEWALSHMQATLIFSEIVESWLMQVCAVLQWVMFWALLVQLSLLLERCMLALGHSFEFILTFPRKIPGVGWGSEHQSFLFLWEIRKSHLPFSKPLPWNRRVRQQLYPGLAGDKKRGRNRKDRIN